VFERRRDSGFFVALLVFTALSLVIYLVGRSVLQPIFDAEFARGIAAAVRKNPQINAGQMAAGQGMATKFTPIIIAFGAFFSPLIVGVALWIVGKFVGAKESIGAACMIATYAFFPRIIGSLLGVVQAFVMDPSKLNGQYRITLSLARFLDPDTASPVMVALLARVDLFTIWVTILLAIGLAVVARIPRSRAALAAFIVWIIGTLPALLGAIRAS
ncbi:MAG: YIP1 family protein, partial [Gemmatimonadaceae bacterium]